MSDAGTPGRKIILIDRYSFWKILASTGQKTYEVGTFQKHEGETEERAMPRALALWEQRKEELTRKDRK